jgi:hypothetical protein
MIEITIAKFWGSKVAIPFPEYYYQYFISSYTQKNINIWNSWNWSVQTLFVFAINVVKFGMLNNRQTKTPWKKS